MNPYEPILKELATGMLMIEDYVNFSDDALFDATLIFQRVLIDKIYSNQNYDKMDFEDRLLMVDKAGKDLRKLIHTYTKLDTVEIVKNYKK